MTRTSKLAGILVTAAVVVLFSVAAIYWIGRAAINASAALLSYHRVISQIHEVLSTLKDAETGQRGYLLTGRENYLDPYNRAVERIRPQLRNLRNQARRNGFSEQDVAHLIQLIDAKLGELQSSVELRRTQGFAAALVAVQSDLGKNSMDAIRAQTAQMVSAEESALSEASRRVARLFYYRNLVAGLSAILNLAILFWAYVRIRDEAAARERTAEEVSRQRNLLDVTLASIGDGVIVTDVLGQITFLNAIAEKLTGWSSHEAVGENYSRIFNIIDESSRTAIENPVEEILPMEPW